MPEIDLNETDQALLKELAEGRNTPANLARRIEISREYASERLKRLVEHGYVQKPDRGIYELVDDPREN